MDAGDAYQAQLPAGWACEWRHGHAKSYRVFTGPKNERSLSMKGAWRIHRGEVLKQQDRVNTASSRKVARTGPMSAEVPSRKVARTGPMSAEVPSQQSAMTTTTAAKRKNLRAFWSMYLHHYLVDDPQTCDSLAASLGHGTFDEWSRRAIDGFGVLQGNGYGLHQDNIASLDVWEHLKELECTMLSENEVDKNVTAFWNLTSLYACQHKKVDQWLRGCAAHDTPFGVDDWRQMAISGYALIRDASYGVPADVAIPEAWKWLFANPEASAAE